LSGPQRIRRSNDITQIPRHTLIRSSKYLEILSFSDVEMFNR
jgi:hypothetical protein